MSMLSDPYKVQINISTRFYVLSLVCVFVSISIPTKRVNKRICTNGTLFVNYYDYNVDSHPSSIVLHIWATARVLSGPCQMPVVATSQKWTCRWQACEWWASDCTCAVPLFKTSSASSNKYNLRMWSRCHSLLVFQW